MINYLPICIILAILGTLLVNPAIYYHLYKKRKEYLEEVNKKKDKGIEVKRSYYRIICGRNSGIGLVIGQALVFIVLFIIAYLTLYLVMASVISWSTILAYLWIPAIAQFFNCVYFSEEFSSLETEVEENVVKAGTVIVIAFFAIPIVIACHKGIYNYINPYDTITFMEEKYSEIPSVNETTMLKEANLAAGSSLKEPVYRNGNWIYPIANDSSHVESSGYLIVDSANGNISFVHKDIEYSPWMASRKNTDLLARRKVPSKVLFGDCIFEIEPETGDVYFCKFYGDYACFRAGRKVEGAILINATTGEGECYPIDKIPDWVTGISF